MADWFTEWQADRVAKGRLLYLRTYGLRALRKVNSTPAEGNAHELWVTPTL